MPTTVSQHAWPIPTGDDYANGPAQFRAALAAIAATLADTYLTREQAAALFAPVPEDGASTGGGAVTATAATGTDVPLRIQGATAQTADLVRFLDAAGDVLARVAPSGRLVEPVTPRRVLTYDDAGNLTGVTLTNSAGTATYATSTLTYDGAGNLTGVTEVADGRTVTRTLNYDSAGNLTLVTEVEN